MRNVFFGTTSRYADRDSFARISGRTMRKSALAALLGGVALTMIGGVANAGTSMGVLSVNATVTSGCSVLAANLGFGSFNPLSVSGPLNVQGGLSLRCTGTTGYSVALDAGLNSGSTPNVNSRKMKNTNTSDTLAYQIYLDSARANVWGSTVGASLGGMGTGSAVSIPIYGQLPDGTAAIPGNYTDTVMVTVTY